MPLRAGRPRKGYSGGIMGSGQGQSSERSRGPAIIAIITAFVYKGSIPQLDHVDPFPHHRPIHWKSYRQSPPDHLVPLLHLP
jgi:hypothetical protein